MKADLCGQCGSPLQYDPRPNNHFIAKCCGRTYDVFVTHDRHLKSAFGGDTGKNRTAWNSRDIIDFLYEGNWQQKYKWEPNES